VPVQVQNHPALPSVETVDGVPTPQSPVVGALGTVMLLLEPQVATTPVVEPDELPDVLPELDPLLDVLPELDPLLDVDPLELVLTTPELDPELELPAVLPPELVEVQLPPELPVLALHELPMLF
jgi:hypothetical protein